MIDHFYINLYPVLSEDWQENKGVGFGQIYWFEIIPVGDPNLVARLYIIMCSTSAYVGLDVRHRYHGYKYTNLGDARQPAKVVWDKVEKELPPLVEAVDKQHKEWEIIENLRETPSVHGGEG